MEEITFDRLVKNGFKDEVKSFTLIYRKNNMCVRFSRTGNISNMYICSPNNIFEIIRELTEEEILSELPRR